MGKYEKLWEGMRKYEEVWERMKKYGKFGKVGKYEKV